MHTKKRYDTSLSGASESSEIFCFTLAIRKSRSKPLFSKGISESYMKSKIYSLYPLNLLSKLRLILFLTFFLEYNSIFLA